MFIRNRDLKITLGSDFNIDISLKQLNRVVKLYEEHSGIVINRIWNTDLDSRVPFITFVNDTSLVIALKINPPLPKRFNLCGNPHKYDNLIQVNNVIGERKNGHLYKGVKCAKCKKYHMVKKDSK